MLPKLAGSITCRRHCTVRYHYINKALSMRSKERQQCSIQISVDRLDKDVINILSRPSEFHG